MTVLRLLLVPALLMTFAAAGGCEMLGGEEEKDRDRKERRRDRISRDRDRDTDLRRDRDRDRDDIVISGDASDGARGLDAIPKRAVRIDQGRGASEVTYKARRDGTLYVYDVDDERIVWQGTLRDGERFILDPIDGVALVDGKRVLDRDLRPRHVFRLYFAEDNVR